MKAPSFKYVVAESVAHCLELLAEHGDEARVLAGGQSLLPSLALRLSAPGVLVDINRTQALAAAPSVSDEAIRLSALTRHADLITSPIVQAHLALLHDAAPWIAHPGVRNRGTVCGSLALGDPASELPACAVAAGATLILESQARGRRAVAARDFYLGLFQNACGADEMIVAVDFPRMDGVRHAFKEVARRRGDYAMVGLAGTARRSGQRLAQVGLAFFGIGDRPVLAVAMGAAVEAADSATQAVAWALEVYERDVHPAADLWCSAKAKKHMGRMLVEEVIHDLFQ